MAKTTVSDGDPDGNPALTDSLVRPAELSHESLRTLIAHAERGGYRLVNWERFGQPRIDRVVATLEGPVGRAGSVVQDVFHTPKVRPRVRDIFPKGIPVIDRLRIEVEVLPGAD